MKKILPAAVLFAMLFSSCATLGIFEQYWPLHKRLVSGDGTIAGAAAIEYAALAPDAQKAVLLDVAGLLAGEKDKDARGRIFAALSDLKAGGFIVVPVIKAAGSNPGVYFEAAAFIKGMDRSDLDLQGLVTLLKDENWEVCAGALGAIGLMADRGELAIPDIVSLMHRVGAQKERYIACFDTLLMINPEIGVLCVIADLTDPDPGIRKNALYKLFELQTYLSKSLPVKKEILPALIRALYSADDTVSALAQELMKEEDSPEAKQAMQAYMGFGKLAFSSLMKLSGTDPQTAFKKQEQSVRDRIEKFYRSIGRADAIENSADMR